MNKILNINLGGYALTIDDDAYEYLSAYLDAIRKRFSENDGRDEIIHDIEMRLGELISQDLGGRTIVMKPEVEAAIQVMGKPEDFGGEAAEPKQTRTSGKFSSGFKIHTGKRLFRDEEDTVAGGVCSGLAAYFGFSDPVWMRLLFVVLTLLSGGFWIPAYVLLWIVVPPAKTAADRLSMRGQTVNVDNIAKEVEDGFERIANQFGPETRRKGQNLVNTGISVIGQIFGFMVRLFARFGSLIAVLVLIGLFILLAIAWVTGVWGLFANASFLGFFSPFSEGFTWLGLANLFLLILIPLFGLCLLLIRMVFNTRSPGWLKTGLGLVWSVNLIVVILMTAFGTKEYRKSNTLSKAINLSEIRSDTLRIEASEIVKQEDYDNDFGFHPEWINLKDDRLIVDGPLDILVQPSESGRFECSQYITARGPSSASALENAANIDFNIVAENNTLHIPTNISIAKGNKWRGQVIKIKIGVPVGKSIVFGKKINERAHCSNYDEDDEGPNLGDHPDRVFRMTAKGLVCSDCPQFGDRDYHGKEYEKFILEGDFDTEIRKGEHFSVQTESPLADKNLIQTIRSGDQITFTTQGKTPKGKNRLIITAPVFTSLDADNSGEVVIRGFKEGEASVSARGNSRIKANFEVVDLSLTLSGKCSVQLTGEGQKLTANLTEGANLQADTWRVEDANISASDNAVARIYVNREVILKKDNTSKVTVDGSAKIKSNEE